MSARGTIAARATGVVHLRLEWYSGGRLRHYETRAEIHRGRFRIDERLPADVAASILNRRGTVETYTSYTGEYQRRIRGELQAYQLDTDQPGRDH